MAPDGHATPLSACVICFQEADRIADCVRSLGFCDEVVVVDSGSTDGTRGIAADLGARVLTNAPFPGFAAQRQFAVDQARYDWVLCLDADERVDPDLAQRIAAMARSGTLAGGYRLSRRSHYLGRVMRHGLFWPDRKLRLFDRRLGRVVANAPHDHVEMRPGTPIVDLEQCIEHLNYRTFGDHLRTIDSYARQAALAMRAAGRRITVLDLLVRPPSVFVKSLLLKLGLLDGWRGFVCAGMAAYHDWLKYWRCLRLPRGARP
ncbi:MAG TPA: glycosyltransferase family 2 protein [Planctomycetota bacterium]|nr:glycosyltransferase family 2 protein [Planctomycetota bacterium]